ncbi:uncharacterized protein PV06_02288 [Exophiala oligosperma]|uniref:Uncharacterized protein n=2 Tax=Chaetothyriales TaxID=34395 RepID=A0A0D2C9X1_9EURO|nr:uncharacterized protein PV06_02288 [Exophiala oligosperma]KIW46627.1 hypothetical protein PV06_02288 [Exophiala oligosperma]
MLPCQTLVEARFNPKSPADQLQLDFKLLFSHKYPQSGRMRSIYALGLLALSSALGAWAAPVANPASALAPRMAEDTDKAKRMTMYYQDDVAEEVDPETTD